jgi:hypothetical protein
MNNKTKQKKQRQARGNHIIPEGRRSGRDTNTKKQSKAQKRSTSNEKRINAEASHFVVAE